MNVPRKIAGILAALLFAATAAMAKAPARQPVALVYSLAGEAVLTAPGAAVRPLRLHDRLAVGTILEVGPGTRLALALVNGRRYELGERSRVTLGAADLASRSGPVRALPAMPPLPLLAPIAKDDRPGPKAGAVRIRREEIDGLCPWEGSATLAKATVLRFRADPGASRHQVEIEDPRGSLIFRVNTETSSVTVPAGALAPGVRYHWSVTALDKPGPLVRGEADFVTLDKRTAEARERLRRAIEAAGDDDSRALLTAVDHSLGLASERCEGPVWRTR